MKVSFVDVKGGLSGSQDIQTHLIYATFGFISGRGQSLIPSGPGFTQLIWREVFAARRIKNKDAYSDIITDIQDAISQIDDLTDDAPDENNKVKYLAHTLRVFYAESLAKTKNWKELENIVQNVSEAGPLASDTYEAILDIIVRPRILVTCLGLTFVDSGQIRIAQWMVCSLSSYICYF